MVGAMLLPSLAGAQEPSPFDRYMSSGFEARRRGDGQTAARDFRLAIAADTGSARARFELGYALLQTTDRRGAAEAFRDGLRRDPTYVDAHRQLGYLWSALGKPRDAVRAFEAARTLGAYDLRDRLEVGYAARRIGDRATAERAFGDASAAVDSGIARAAMSALTALRGAPPSALARFDRFADLYAAPLYQTRYTNFIAQAVARAGIVADHHVRVSPYLSLRVSRDTRSRGGPQPAIFSDNVVVPAVGVRLQPLRPLGVDGLYLYGEAGPTIPLVTPNGSRRRGDVRAGGMLVEQWRAGPAGRRRSRVPLTLLTELYADASVYSRFDHDLIGFAQLRQSVRVLEDRGRGVDLFVRLWNVADSRKVYYNNAVELSSGIGLFPDATRRTFVYVESLRGRYTRSPGGDVSRSYRDLRVTAVLAAYRWWSSDR